MYVYEYLIHAGATKSAQLFLQEVSLLLIIKKVLINSFYLS